MTAPLREPAATETTRRFKALDLFCGLGGWSDGLALEGFDVTGVEIEEKIAKLYRHKVIVSDVCALDPSDFKGFDLIVGSPPCRNFTVGSDAWWKIKKSPEEGLRLIRAFLSFIEVAKPNYWLMENVRGAVNLLGMEPRGYYKLSRSMIRAFWGNYPSFLVPNDHTKPLMKVIDNYPKTAPRQWIKAKIPLPVARALGAAIRQALEATP